MKCLVVDDELLARDLLKEYIGKIAKLQLVNVCSDAIEALNYLQQNKVDVIFLDINMPELTGIEFLNALQIPPKVILTTAYSEYALEGYEHGVIDYLLKPIAFPRFLKTVNRILNNAEPASQGKEVKDDGVLIIKEEGIPRKVYFDAILYIKSFGNYLKVITEAKTYVMLGTISGIEETLPSHFLRVHRSYIVNVSAIQKVSAKHLKINDTEIPISPMYKIQLQEKLSE